MEKEKKLIDKQKQNKNKKKVKGSQKASTSLTNSHKSILVFD